MQHVSNWIYSKSSRHIVFITVSQKSKTIEAATDDSKIIKVRRLLNWCKPIIISKLKIERNSSQVIKSLFIASHISESLNISTSTHWEWGSYLFWTVLDFQLWFFSPNFWMNSNFFSSFLYRVSSHYVKVFFQGGKISFFCQYVKKQ